MTVVNLTFEKIAPQRWKTLQEFYLPVFKTFLIYFFSFTLNPFPLWIWQYCCFRLLLLCVTQGREAGVERGKVNNSSTKTHKNVSQLQEEDIFGGHKRKLKLYFISPFYEILIISINSIYWLAKRERQKCQHPHKLMIHPLFCSTITLFGCLL